MSHPPETRRPAYADIPPSKRHDGSIEGYRRQRRQALQERIASEDTPRPREPERTQ